MFYYIRRLLQSISVMADNHEDIVNMKRISVCLLIQGIIPFLQRLPVIIEDLQSPFISFTFAVNNSGYMSYLLQISLYSMRFSSILIGIIVLVVVRDYRNVYIRSIFRSCIWLHRKQIINRQEQSIRIIQVKPVVNNKSTDTLITTPIINQL